MLCSEIPSSLHIYIYNISHNQHLVDTHFIYIYQYFSQPALGGHTFHIHISIFLTTSTWWTHIHKHIYILIFLTTSTWWTHIHINIGISHNEHLVDTCSYTYLGLSPLRQHLFRHYIVDSPMCLLCDENEEESVTDYVMKCPRHTVVRDLLLLKMGPTLDKLGVYVFLCRLL